MEILNKEELATTRLRKDAVAIIEAGYTAVDVEELLKNRVMFKRDTLFVSNLARSLSFGFKSYKRVHITGVGKGSWRAVSGLAKIVGSRLSSACAIDVKGALKPERADKKIKFFSGTHPKPSLMNVRATQYLVRSLETFDEEDFVIFFIGGGGSALLCSTEEEMEQSSSIFDQLTRKGAKIQELNIVRKHLSMVKGGGLARIAYPATSLSLIVSDVIGNDVSVIASGPTVYDWSSVADAKRILKEYRVKAPWQLIETPKEKHYFERAHNLLLACNEDAASAMLEKARSLGYRARIGSLGINGEARESLVPFTRKIRSGQVTILAGETTVHLNGKGKGGRNQEACLGVIDRALEGALNLRETLVASFSSDGYDNTPVAGALVDGELVKTILDKNLEPSVFLAGNDSFSFFKKIGGHIRASRDAFNVSDLMLVMKEK